MTLDEHLFHCHRPPVVDLPQRVLTDSLMMNVGGARMVPRFSDVHGIMSLTRKKIDQRQVNACSESLIAGLDATQLLICTLFWSMIFPNGRNDRPMNFGSVYPLSRRYQCSTFLPTP